MENYNSEPSAEQQKASDVLKSVNLMSVGVAVLLSAGMVLDKNSVTVSVLSGVGFYGAIAGLLVLWQPEGLPRVLVNRQQEVTLRRRDVLQYKMHMASAPTQRVSMVDPLRLPDSTPAPLSNFVPAVPAAEPRLKLAAVEFVSALFDDNGAPNAKRILPATSKRPGQIQRSKPRDEVMEYLQSLGMVWVNPEGMAFFHVDVYPTLQEAVNTIKRGTPRGAGAIHPYPSPLYPPPSQEMRS